MITQFENKVLKRCKDKNFRIKHSNGTKQAWRWIKKNKWLKIGQPITERQFGYIIKKINDRLVSKLLAGNDIILPSGMGKIELRKYKSKIQIQNNKVITNLPVNWKRTIDWWKEDSKAYKNKYLIRHETNMLFNIHYNKKGATYKNKNFYQFIINRRIKKLLSDKIKNNEIDTFLLDYGRIH